MSTSVSHAASKSVTLRRAEARDVEPCGRIIYRAFGSIAAAHGCPAEIPSEDVGIMIAGMLFNNPGFYCLVAERDGKIVGSNCLDERNIISGVGPITIDPGEQNSGSGRKLMEAVIERSDQRGFPGVRLVQAGYHARSLSLYTKLGFAAREQLVVMNGVPRADTRAFAVRPAQQADLTACNSLCTAVHGFARGEELRQAIAHGSAFVAERDGAIRGYTTGLGYFGYSVAESNDAIGALLAQATWLPSLGALFPTRNYALFRWCLDHGMRSVQTMTLMARGLYQQPDGPYLPSILY